MIHEMKPLRITSTHLLLCFILHPFSALFLGLNQYKSCEEVDPAQRKLSWLNDTTLVLARILFEYRRGVQRAFFMNDLILEHRIWVIGFFKILSQCHASLRVLTGHDVIGNSMEVIEPGRILLVPNLLMK